MLPRPLPQFMNFLSNRVFFFHPQLLKELFFFLVFGLLLVLSFLPDVYSHKLLQSLSSDLHM